MTISTDLAKIARDPSWLPHRYDPVRDAVHFLAVPRKTHDAMTFLTDEYLPADLPKLVLSQRDAAAAAKTTAAPIHYVFHSAYCCSTLVARAFDLPGAAMGLKEPVILNDLVGWRRRGGDGKAIGRALDGALTLLAQPFGAGEAIVVKPSNIVNVLAPAMLSLRPASRALLLYAPLRTYLRSVAKKGMWGRLWVRELFIGQMKDGIVDLGFDDEQHFGQTDLQIAAAGWLAQQALFARIVAQFGPRARTLDSETLVARPEAAMAALGTLFGIALNADAIAAGPIFTRHSKFDIAFDAGSRAAEHADAANLHADEIEKVAAWGEAVAKSAGIPMTLGAPLLGKLEQ